MSINENDLPADIKKQGQRTYRSIIVDKKEIEFSAGFMDLHTRSYQEISKDKGFWLTDSEACINSSYHKK